MVFLAGGPENGDLNLVTVSDGVAQPRAARDNVDLPIFGDPHHRVTRGNMSQQKNRREQSGNDPHSLPQSKPADSESVGLV